jgi:hypothetical protein
LDGNVQRKDIEIILNVRIHLRFYDVDKLSQDVGHPKNWNWELGGLEKGISKHDFGS